MPGDHPTVLKPEPSLYQVRRDDEKKERHRTGLEHYIVSGPDLSVLVAYHCGHWEVPAKRGAMTLSGEQQRRPYTKPDLRTYGDLREITANVSATGVKNDHGGMGLNKT